MHKVFFFGWIIKLFITIRISSGSIISWFNRSEWTSLPIISRFGVVNVESVSVLHEWSSQQKWYLTLQLHYPEQIFRKAKSAKSKQTAEWKHIGNTWPFTSFGSCCCLYEISVHPYLIWRNICFGPSKVKVWHITRGSHFPKKIADFIFFMVSCVVFYEELLSPL